MNSNKSLSVTEIIDILETEEFWDGCENDCIDRVYTEPPEYKAESDEDSGDESAGLLDNLSGKQLQASAEVVFHSGKRIGSEDLEGEEGPSASRFSQNWHDLFHSEDELPLSTFVQRKAMADSWKGGADLANTNRRIFPEASFSRYRNTSPIEIFELFISEDVIQLLVEESNRYALFINCPDPKITPEEIKCFLAILIVSGYDKKPSKKSYWDSGNDLRNTAVYNAMRRDRFIRIMHFMPCADNNNLNLTDKITKLRPLINKIKTNFMKCYVPEQEVSYDESMIEYFGRHGCKQYIRGKPIRFGYKVWCANSKSGYLINFEVYQGCIPGSNPDYQKTFGKAASPLLEFITQMPHEYQCLPFRFYFNNLFTVKLLYHLKEKGYEGTGTIRENRLPKSCPLRCVKQMKKTKRGTFCYASTIDGKVVATRWMDNAVVTVVSIVHGVYPVSNASRYSSAEKKRIGISRPDCIGKYNDFMGGTDQMDANINIYRIGIRGKKWWWPIFTWLIDSCLQNAWILFRKHNPNVTQLAFRREIAQASLQKFQNLPKSAGRPSTYSSHSRVAPDVRYDRLDHIIENVPNNKRRRCAGNHTPASAVRMQCRKCNL